MARESGSRSAGFRLEVVAAWAFAAMGIGAATPSALAGTGLTSGQTVSGAIDFLGDVDTYTIDANAGESLLFALADDVGSTGFSVWVQLFAPGDVLVVEDSGTGGVELTASGLPSTGTYTFVIRELSDDSTGGYTFTATIPDDGVVDANNVAISSGQTVMGMIDDGDIDTFTIDALAGESLLFALADDVASTSFSVRVQLYAPDGTLADANAGTGGVGLTTTSLPATGTYTYVIRELSADSTGGYTFTATIPDDGVVDADNVAISSGQTVMGMIDDGDIDTFTIDADAGESLLFALADGVASTSFNVQVRLYAPDGSLADANAGTGGVGLTTSSLPATGTYTYVIRELSSDSTGGYTFTATIPDDEIDSDNVAISSGQTVMGMIDDGDIDTFTIDADAGESLLFALADDVASTSFNVQVQLYAPDGSLADANAGTGGVGLTSTSLSATGTYTYVIRELSADSTGGYTFTATIPDDGVVDADNVVISSGQTVMGMIDDGDIDTFTIDADAGESLLFALADDIASTSFSVQVQLYAPDGSLADANAGTGGVGLTTTSLPGTGTYTYVIRELSADSTGGYTFTATIPDDEIDADNEAITDGQVVDASIDPGDIDTFTIEAEAGKRLILALVDDVASTSFSVWVQLYAPDGSLVAAGAGAAGVDVSGCDLPTTGTYTIVVRELSADSTGGYTFSTTIRNSVVTFVDINSVLQNWLNDYTPLTGPGDCDRDGVVGFADINWALANWLELCP